MLSFSMGAAQCIRPRAAGHGRLLMAQTTVCEGCLVGRCYSHALAFCEFVDRGSFWQAYGL